MSRITRVNIENYRGIKDLRFKPNRINIFVGRNNAGKSSALEAITLAISSLNNFKDLLGRDIVSEIVERRRRYSTKYFINVATKKSEISLEINSSSKLKLVLEYFDASEYPKSEVGMNFISFLEKQSLEVVDRSPLILELRHSLLEKNIKKDELENFYELLTRRIEDEKNKFVNHIMNLPKLFFVSYLNNKILSEGVYLGPDFKARRRFYLPHLEGFFRLKTGRSRVSVPILFGMARRVLDINQLYDAAVRKNKISKVLDILRINLENFDDLRKVEEEILCTFQNVKEPIPLPFMGDGFITMTKIIFLSTLAEKGIIVLEEPENNLHPGYLRIAAEQIAENKDTQFFLSTHNIELIEYLLEQKEELDEIQFIRMYRYSDGDLGYEILSSHEAEYELDELKADLRGT